MNILLTALLQTQVLMLLRRSFLTYFNPTVSYAARGCTVATDFVVLVLTWVKTWRLREQAKAVKMASPIATLLLRDGKYCSNHPVRLIAHDFLLRDHLFLVSISPVADIEDSPLNDIAAF